jgi:hypothetical protein
MIRAGARNGFIGVLLEGDAAGCSENSISPEPGITHDRRKALP